MSHLISMGHRRLLRGAVVAGLFAALLLGLSACANGAVNPTPPAVLTAGPTAAATATGHPTTIAPSAQPTETLDSTLALTWWTPEFLSPGAPQPAGSLLAEQLAAFEASQGGQVRVTPVLKARYGQGGLLDFLRTAQAAAPSVLPDLVTLDVTDLEQAVAAGLLQPLDGLLDEAVTAGLYPFAASAGLFDGQRMAVQYIANLEHLAYLTSQVQTPPATWEAVLADDLPYLFPLGAPQANSATNAAGSLQHVVLSQYLSTGPTLDPMTRVPLLELEPVIRLLEFYDTAADIGVLPPGAQDLTESDAVWAVYVQGKVPLAHVSARRYVAEHEALRGSGFAAAPGWAGPATPIANGWALAIVTTDPERQQAAAALIAWLLQPENSGAWVHAAGWLPTAPDALKIAGSTPYHNFLDGQMRVAISPPIGAEYAVVAARLQQAITRVLQEGVSPVEAAQEAVTPAR